MSLEALTWAFKQQPNKSGEKFVLVALANYSDENWYSYPSQRRLAELTGMKERAVRGHLASLEEQEFITREHRQTDSGHRTSDGIYINRQKMPQGENPTGKKRQNLPANIAANTKEDTKDLYIKRVKEQFGQIPNDIWESLSWLARLEDYPRDIKANIEHLEKLKSKYPHRYLSAVVDEFCDYYEEQGFKKDHKPRARLTLWMKNAASWETHARKSSSGSSAGNGSAPKFRRKKKVV